MKLSLSSFFNQSAWILCLVMAAGCSGPSFDTNLKRIVAREEVAGTWALAPETRRLIPKTTVQAAGTSASTITFSPDGTCVFDSFFGVDWRALKENGHWQLQHDVTVDSNGVKKNALFISLKSGERFYLYFMEEDQKLKLWNYYGDPDSMKLIVYQKQ